MSTKNISITDDAYARLAALKEPNESFSQVIRRITERRSILELAGILSESEAREFKKAVGASRKLSVSRTAGIEEKWESASRKRKQ
jgi:predicted CopG family antitoxin